MLSPSSAAPSKWKANVSLVLDWRFDLLVQHFNTLSFSLFQTEPAGKPWAKKLKVTPLASAPLPSSLLFFEIDPWFSADYKPGSKALLALLSQVDVAIESIQLSDNPSAVPQSQLQKHCASIKLAVQQQLLALDLGLQTYKLASEHLDCLDKLLEHPKAAQTGKLLDNLHISSEVCFILLFFFLY